MKLLGTMTFLAAAATARPGAAPVATLHAQVPGGTLAYDDTQGAGPVVICVPGMGERRGSYRLLAPLLAEAGHRVITLDVRGHGESSVGWTGYAPFDVGADILAFMDSLGIRTAHLVGNSFAAGSVYWVAVTAPGRVSSLTFLDPSVTEGKPNALLNLFVRAAFARPWGVGFWLKYWDGLFPVSKPDDFTAYRAALGSNLREPGRLEALSAMVLTSHAPVEAILGRARVPVLIVMGTRDKDFPDPAAEAATVGQKTGATIRLLETGHYPHVERPRDVADIVLPFLGTH